MRALWSLLQIYVFVTFLTMAAAYYVDAPYVLLFKHTGGTMLAVFLYVGLLGIIWDGSLIIAGLIFETWRRWGPYGSNISITVNSTRKIRFFTRGLSPLILILITSFIIYGTGNITLISLKLIGSTTEWRDPYFWAIEGPVLEWIADFPINTSAWDKLYHSAWGLELFAAFALVVIGRSSKVVLSYCVSMILLFIYRPVFRRFKPGYGASILQAGTVQIPQWLTYRCRHAKRCRCYGDWAGGI